MILVWKNNEWKSNILKALNICMNVLTKRQRRYAYTREHENLELYARERDFPITLKNKRWEQKTKFILTFWFNGEEIKEVKKSMKINLNWELQIEIILWQWLTDKNIKFLKRWKTFKEVEQRKLIDYISQKINFIYIPAIRTEWHTMNIIDEMISNALSNIEENEDYQKAIQIIKDLQKPIFEKISHTVKESVSQLIPSIKSVETYISEDNMHVSFRSRSELRIDDWTKTKIEFKWDWIKSLVALSLLKDFHSKNKFSLIAIEEPESHLHPWAIHQLKEVIYDLWLENQLLISTHNSLFINSDFINSNIIVDQWKARPAKTIKEIRDTLWIQAADNLINSSKVLVVEWENDVKSLKAIFSWNEIIQKKLNNNSFNIIPLHSASNLLSCLQNLENSAIKYIVLLDNDEGWKIAYEKAKKSWLLNDKNVRFTNCEWMKESEFEDCINENIYKDKIFEAYSIDITKWKKKYNNKKWSEKMENIFFANWKPRSDSIKDRLKVIVSNSIWEHGKDSLNKVKWNIILLLEKHIEDFIK